MRMSHGYALIFDVGLRNFQLIRKKKWRINLSSLYQLRHYWSKIFRMLPEPVSKLLMTDLCIIKEIIILYTQPSGRKFRWKLCLSKQVSRISLKGKPLKISNFLLPFIPFFIYCSYKKTKLQRLVSCAHHHWLWSTKREKIIGSGEILLFWGRG